MLITHKPRFLVDCGEVSGPFLGSKVRWSSNLAIFLWSSFACKDNQNLLKKSPFSAILLCFVNRQWNKGIRMLIMLQICNLIKKGTFSVQFLQVFVGTFWQPFFNQDSHLFLPFFIQSHSQWCQEDFCEESTSVLLVIMSCFGFFGQGLPWLLTKVAAVGVTFFFVATATGGYGWYCDILKHYQKHCFQKWKWGFWFSVPYYNVITIAYKSTPK